MSTPSEPTPGAEVLNRRPMPWLKPVGLIAAAVAVIVVAAGLVTRGMAGQSLKSWTDAQVIPTVDVVRPDAGGGAQTLVLPGQVQAFNDAPIHARVPGYLKAWYHDIGDKVQAGALLAEIDTPDLDQQLGQAKADLATAVANQRLAQTTAARWNGLLAQDAVSHQEAEEKNGDLDAKTSLVNAAKANVGRLAALESFKRITAPFAGTVTARTTDIGQLISVGAQNDPGLFTIADVHRLRIYVSVPQAYAAQIHPGQIVSLQAPDYPGRTFQATLVGTSDSMGAQTGALQAEARIDNPDGALKPGDYVQATLALPSAGGTLRLPANALMFRQSGLAAAVVGASGRVMLKPVTIARDLGTTVEISAGLSPGDAVIANPPDSLISGEAVKVAGTARAAG